MNAPVDPEYWQNQLEGPLADVLARTEKPPFFATWVDGVSPACRRVLARELGLPREMPQPALRMAGKRRSAIVEVARAVLGADDLEGARSGAALDRRALGWTLHLRGAANLQR